jgi:hypothetical protein
VQQIPITAEPNQEFTADLDGLRFLVRLKETNGVMVADITIDDAVILSATRVLAGEPLIPYGYLEQGNLVMLTDADALPDYPQFGATQFLFYMSAAEIAAL